MEQSFERLNQKCQANIKYKIYGCDKTQHVYIIEIKTINFLETTGTKQCCGEANGCRQIIFLYKASWRGHGDVTGSHNIMGRESFKYRGNFICWHEAGV